MVVGLVSGFMYLPLNFNRNLLSWNFHVEIIPILAASYMSRREIELSILCRGVKPAQLRYTQSTLHYITHVNSLVGI